MARDSRLHTDRRAISLIALTVLTGLGVLTFVPIHAAEKLPAVLASKVIEPGDIDKAGSERTERGKAATLPIPRFVSLQGEPVNLRTGPGLRYPLEWVYNRRRLPVEVIAEFDVWRRIRDPDGSEGWVHQTMLTGRRTGIVRGAAQALYRSNAGGSDTLATLEAGVIVNIQRCPAGPLCRVEVNGVHGWINRDQIWGVYPNEVI